MTPREPNTPAPPGWFVPLCAVAGAGALGLAVLLRLNRIEALGTVTVPTPFAQPWHRPPLFDAITAAFGGRPDLPALCVGLVAVALTFGLARPALPLAGRLLVLLLAAAAPAMVLAGALWVPAALVVPAAAWAALLLAGVLSRHDGGSPGLLAVATALLLMTDWPAWAPVLAWLGWLLVFRPAGLDPRRANRALIALGVGAAIGGVAAGFVLLHGGRPDEAMKTAHAPLGREAAQALVDAVAAPWLGTGRGVGPGLRAAVAVLVAGMVWMGWRRARRAGAGAWAGTLVVGSAGALIPALAIHPVLPFAVDKHLWYTSPMVLCLLVASIWPIDGFEAGPPPTTTHSKLAPAAIATTFLVLALALSGCTDEDGDGWAVEQGDCDDTQPTVYPDAPEIWADGLDNDCDDVIDQSDTYIYLDEAEPNDTTLGSCFAPGGQDVGHLAGEGLLTRITGRISDVVDQSYDEGDLDCYAFRVPDGVDHPRLIVELTWEDATSDLDLSLAGLWEGEQAGFGNSQAPGPPPEILPSSSGFDAGAPLWLWIAAYDGPPTDYTVDLVLR